MQNPIFIVSAGRSGSTFLAKLINQHPEIVCVSDIFEPIRPGAEPLLENIKPISGSDFFKLISRPSYEARIRYWREHQTPEQLFVPENESMVSLILSYTLPFSDDDPVGCLKEYEQFCLEQPARVAAEHLVSFFEWMRQRFGGRLWVERTGGALSLTPEITEVFPNAKIIHCHRDGRECSIFMRNYPFFRMYHKMLKEQDFVLEDWDFDEMPPLESIAQMWSDWVVMAEDALKPFPEEQKRWLSYEDLTTKTVQTLTNLILYVLDKDDLSEVDRDWIKACVSQVTPSKKKLPFLSDEEKERQYAACKPGLERLGYV